ncbi:MAG: hypothetical protein BroJett003_25740 [Planctomycetota bacterium]|nr:MAG: hypothetical protein BroJett003_25740 [Planctomycetota bacterium]
MSGDARASKEATVELVGLHASAGVRSAIGERNRLLATESPALSDQSVNEVSTRVPPQVIRLRRYDEPHPDDTDTPEARHLRTVLSGFKRRDLAVTTKKVRNLLAALTAGAADDPLGARVILLGHFDVPQVGEKYFEPEVIPATRLLGRRLYAVPVFGAIVLLMLLQCSRVIPVILPMRNIGGFAYVLMMGGAVTAAWLWRGMIRPTYLRVSPGLVEFLSYRWFWHNRAEIRSYPLTTGTSVIVLHSPTFTWSTRLTKPLPDRREAYEDQMREKHPNALTVFFERNGREERLDVALVFQAELFRDLLWSGLLSTAPIRTPTQDDLVG